jgi:DNA invertase Pin-like site-specific DNA recombinase
MKANSATKIVRCAIYTRKSSEEGLDQAFNSLHAQREACEAYVKSQVAEGWRALPSLYDDGGFSGGSMERPALKRLLADVDAGRVDTVVVYKVDRLTRSLADFAKIVERLDAEGASFVSVTQAFNTTSSMGRLTLNVLLSFAQFEREVTGERIRDKIAASKARGMWMGGCPPLGYDPPVDPLTRALVVNPIEAETVRLIFEGYLTLGSVSALENYLHAEGIQSKTWTAKTGRRVGGCRINRGALFHLLKSRLYLGEIPHGDKSFPGAHSAIIDVDLFDRVQARLTEQRRERRQRPTRVATMALKGLLFDTDGSPMSPVFGYGRAGRIYRYYVSAPLQQGRSVRPSPDAIRRIAAGEIESLVREQLLRRVRAPADAPLSDLAAALRRIDVHAASIQMTLVKTALERTALEGMAPHESDTALAILTLPIRCKLRGGRTWITPPPGSTVETRPRRDPALIRALRQAHELTAVMAWRPADGGLETLNVKAPESPYDRKICRLAFLAPDLQRAILEGRQPPALSLERLMREAIPRAWPDQRRFYGASDD